MSHRLCVGKHTPARPIGAHKVGIAKLTYRKVTVSVMTRPQIAPTESTKHCRASSIRAFALQGVIDFLNRISHKYVSGHIGRGVSKIIGGEPLQPKYARIAMTTGMP